MKEFPFHQTFSCILKSLVSEEKDKYLALASLEQVGKFISNIDTTKNIDLLPIAFNACVVNRVNKNADALDTKTALAIYKEFINKPINLEHNRQKVVGVILTAGFSEFGSDKPLSEDDVRNLITPFNITLGGIVWKIVNPEISDIIEDASDPTSERYMSISASWELGFVDYNIAILPPGIKNLAEAEIVVEPSKITELEPLLKSRGGDGKFGDNFIYRIPKDDVIPLGIGLTEKPAAEVKGVATPQPEPPINAIPTEAVEAVEENKKIISQKENSNVKIERQNLMKIESLTDITDEAIKQATASDVSTFIANELKKGSEIWEKEKGSLNEALSQAKAASEKVSADNAKLLEDMKSLQATVETLAKEKAEREQVEKFNVRMASISEKFNLDDETRAALVEDLKAIASDEDFEKWMKKTSILLKGFAKKACAKCGKAECKCEDEEEDMEAKKKCKASEEASASTVVETAIDNASKDKVEITNTSTTDKKTLKETYQAAFAKENFVIKY